MIFIPMCDKYVSYGCRMTSSKLLELFDEQWGKGLRIWTTRACVDEVQVASVTGGLNKVAIGALEGFVDNSNQCILA